MADSGTEQVEAYIEALFATEDDMLMAARAAMREAGLPSINVSPTLGRTLHLLARIAGATRILEIGTLGGYSAIWLARALPPHGTLLSLEVEPRHAEVARANLERAGLDHKVEIRLGPALDSLAALVAVGTEPFDVIFIDADKPGYPAYLDAALRLSRPGTVILADNVLQRGRVVNPQADGNAGAIRRFNQLVADDERLDAVILPVLHTEIDGLVVARVRDHSSA